MKRYTKGYTQGLVIQLGYFNSFFFNFFLGKGKYDGCGFFLRGHEDFSISLQKDSPHHKASSLIPINKRVVPDNAMNVSRT